jgi:hypothetical protein
MQYPPDLGIELAASLKLGIYQREKARFASLQPCLFLVAVILDRTSMPFPARDDLLNWLDQF